MKHKDGPLTAEFTIHPKSPARRVACSSTAGQFAKDNFPRPRQLRALRSRSQGRANITVTLAVDKTFSVPGDGRQLGILIIGNWI